jgi:hypothetical protein
VSGGLGTSWSLVVLCVPSASREGGVTASVAYRTHARRSDDGPGPRLQLPGMGPGVTPDLTSSLAAAGSPTTSYPPAEEPRTVGPMGQGAGSRVQGPAPEPCPTSLGRDAPQGPATWSGARWSPSQEVPAQGPGSPGLGPYDSDPRTVGPPTRGTEAGSRAASAQGSCGLKRLRSRTGFSAPGRPVKVQGSWDPAGHPEPVPPSHPARTGRRPCERIRASRRAGGRAGGVLGSHPAGPGSPGQVPVRDRHRTSLPYSLTDTELPG